MELGSHDDDSNAFTFKYKNKRDLLDCIGTSTYETIIVNYYNLRDKLNELDNKIQNKESEIEKWKNKYNECLDDFNRAKLSIKNKESEFEKSKNNYNECLNELNIKFN